MNRLRCNCHVLSDQCIFNANKLKYIFHSDHYIISFDCVDVNNTIFSNKFFIYYNDDQNNN